MGWLPSWGLLRVTPQGAVMGTGVHGSSGGEPIDGQSWASGSSALGHGCPALLYSFQEWTWPLCVGVQIHTDTPSTAHKPGWMASFKGPWLALAVAFVQGPIY